MTYLLLIYEFIKTGLFSIGGGLATLPFLQAMADRYPWFNRQLLIDMIAISESTPGPIGINMATYAGFRAGGVLGGVVASLALVVPSVVIVSVISKALKQFTHNRRVQAAFYGLRPCAAALIAWAVLDLASQTVVNLEILPALEGIHIGLFILAVVIFIAMRLYKKLQPLFIFVAAAVIGVVFKL